MVRETSVCYSHNILSAISPSCTIRASTDDSRCFYPVVNNTVPLRTSEKITTWRYKSIWSFHWNYCVNNIRDRIRFDFIHKILNGLFGSCSVDCELMLANISNYRGERERKVVGLSLKRKWKWKEKKKRNDVLVFGDYRLSLTWRVGDTTVKYSKCKKL